MAHTCNLSISGGLLLGYMAQHVLGKDFVFKKYVSLLNMDRLVR